MNLGSSEGAKDHASGSFDKPTVDGFGYEWTVYDQTERDPESIRASFQRYFVNFPWDELQDQALGVDVGSGSGRWAALVSERGFPLVAIDASQEALRVTRRAASSAVVLNASAVEMPLGTGTVEFAFSLGVLHHLPDTAGALAEIHRVLRPNAPFLLYLYYAFDNRPTWFRMIWQVSDLARRRIALLPYRPRLYVTTAIAALVYWPLSRLARLLALRGTDVDTMPLSSYRDQPFYVLRTDALDRFGTGLEKRYTKSEIKGLLSDAGFGQVSFNEEWPYWCAMARA